MKKEFEELRKSKYFKYIVAFGIIKKVILLVIFLLPLLSYSWFCIGLSWNLKYASIRPKQLSLYKRFFFYNTSIKKTVPILIYVLIASCFKKPDCNCGTVEGLRVDFLVGTVDSEFWFLDIRKERTQNIETDLQVTFSVYRIYTFNVTT